MQKRVLHLCENTLDAELLRISLNRFDFEYTRLPLDYEFNEDFFHSLSIDALITEIGLTDFSILPNLETLRGWNPCLGIVFLTNCPDLRLIGLSIRQLPLGAQIINRKDAWEINQLVQAIHDSSRAASDREDAKMVPALPERSHGAGLMALSSLQIETLRLVAQGLSNAEIAKEREVSEKSIEHMVAKIAQNLELKAASKINLRVCLASEYFKFLT
jgi:DNA-binding NarL/FixJ family response regulator